MDNDRLEPVVFDRLREGFSREETGDIEGAINSFKAAARLGSADACSKLGTIFDDVASPPRRDEAAYWYKKGVKRGDSGCAWNLAMHYAGLRKKRWYLYWLSIAKQMGDPDADVELSTQEWWKKRSNG